MAAKVQSPIDPEIIKKLFQEIKRHHADVVDQACEEGCILPYLKRGTSIWYDPGSKTIDLNAPCRWFFVCKISADILQPLTLEALTSMETSLQTLPTIEGGLERYFAEMRSASEISPNRLFLASQEGANRYFDTLEDGTHRPPAHRVCLSNRDGVDPEAISKFKSNTHVPLDDGAPIIRKFSATLDEFKTFFEALKKTFELYQNEPESAILIHCTQGQSRSVLFTILFLLLLVQTGLKTIDGVDSSSSNSAILSCCIDYMIDKRPIISLSDRWHPFLDFFFASDCRIYDILYPPEKKEEEEKQTPTSAPTHIISSSSLLNDDLDHPTFSDFDEEEFNSLIKVAFDDE